jgi:hypothetical protein
MQHGTGRDATCQRVDVTCHRVNATLNTKWQNTATSCSHKHLLKDILVIQVENRQHLVAAGVGEPGAEGVFRFKVHGWMNSIAHIDHVESEA